MPSGDAGGLVDRHEQLEPAAPDLELDVRLVDLELVLDHVADELAVEAEELVAGPEPRTVGRRTRRDRHHTAARPACVGGGHGTPVYGLPSAAYPRRVADGRDDTTGVQRVLLAEPRGFCAGVEMAIKALQAMVEAFDPPVYCYHEIVHNQLVVDRFRAQGVVFVDDVDDGARRRAAHAVGPRLRTRGGRRGPRT